MRRKLIKQANQAVTITLPIEWVRDNNLKPGDEIELEENEKRLILKSNKKTIWKSVKLNTTGYPPRMKHVYNNAAYAKGVDEIEIESDKKYFPDLTQTIGFAVVSYEDKIKIKDVSGVSSENLDEIFKRVFQMIINFYEAAIKDIFGESNKTMESLTKRDREINKFSLFLQRSIMKHSYPNRAKGKIMFAYSFALEQIGDEIVRLWETNIDYKIKKDKKIKDFLLFSQEGLEKAFDIYYQTSSKDIRELMEMKKEMRKNMAKFKNLDLGTYKLLRHAVKIIEDASDLTHLSLMNKF